MLSDSDTEDAENQPLCKYGAQCYQRNKQHIEKYKHPPKKDVREASMPSKKLRTESGSLKQQTLRSFFSKNVPKKLPIETASGEETAERNVNPESIESTSSTAATTSSSSSSRVRSTETSGEEEISPKKLSSEPIESTSSAVATTSSSSSSQVCLPKYLPGDNEKFQKIIEKLFLVRMPPDFFSLWEFCCNISSNNPTDALKTLKLRLVGPFDVLNGTMKDDIESSSACLHWRYFFDPPEFQTVLKSDNESELLHFGYYRDDPKELPVFVGYNKAAKDAIITPIGENIFAAISWYVNQIQDKDNPFQMTQLSSLKKELQKWTNTKGYTLKACTDKMRARDKMLMVKPLHRAGIVVPYDPKTQLGYRPVASTPTELVKILNMIENSETDKDRKFYMSQLQQVITWANIAVDEGDYGTALELGIDLFCFRSKLFNSMILQLLTTTYKLLKRDAFATIIKAHLANRKEGGDLSVLKK